MLYVIVPMNTHSATTVAKFSSQTLDRLFLVHEVKTMARFINGRLLLTFLPASPTKETKPSWEMIMKEFDKTHKRIAHSLQRLEDSLSRESTSEKNKEILGDELGLECGEPTVIDKPTNEEHEVEILEQSSPLQEYLDKACSTLSLSLHSGEKVWYTGEGAKFSRWVLQVD